jgi:hypothetical protein
MPKTLCLLMVSLIMVSACGSLTEEMDDSGTSSYAWPVYFMAGGVYDTNMSENYYVRCVRGSSSVSSYYLPDTGQTVSHTDTFGEDNDYLIHPPAYRDNGDGTVNDLNTGLIWQQATSDSEMDVDSAGSYCSGLSLAGYSDWRLPNIYELQSIVDYGKYGPSIDTTAFPGTKSFSIWSSTTDISSFGAWLVGFYNGIVSYEHKSDKFSVRCVRGGN